MHQDGSGRKHGNGRARARAKRAIMHADTRQHERSSAKHHSAGCIKSGRRVGGASLYLPARRPLLATSWWGEGIENAVARPGVQETSQIAALSRHILSRPSSDIPKHALIAVFRSILAGNPANYSVVRVRAWQAYTCRRRPCPTHAVICGIPGGIDRKHRYLRYMFEDG